ncbi:hypothetical protein ABFU82_25020 [Nocardioides sp. WV_118_6]|uniref:hypothetical protein n=1 Tax=Nocardioides simplex TaxID=2045 RepID=UPI002150148C|nr:hypothetical protein [Pimelobacter simplex]UUW91884.1 hypothetical protein M0M43_10485 [Pimelobacter simplex]UUW95712.1 hypothetical protein M0M48_28985 [Pimelobacter simplex]
MSTTTPSALTTSGAVELAAGALSGWIYTLAIADKERARRLGIVSTPRVRQWHLDLAALGTATVALGAALPDAPAPLQRTLAAGAWSNAMLFLPLAFRPELADDRRYRVAVAGSFVTTSVGFVGFAATALRRRRAARR